MGQVYRALRHGTSEVAVKHIPCMAADPQRLQHLMQREIAIMKRVSYDANVVQFYGACSGDDGAWVCMELMEVRIRLHAVDASHGLSKSARTLRRMRLASKIRCYWMPDEGEGTAAKHAFGRFQASIGSE